LICAQWICSVFAGIAFLHLNFLACLVLGWQVTAKLWLAGADTLTRSGQPASWCL